MLRPTDLHRLLLSASVFALAPLAAAQNFNVDCISVPTAPVPSSSYGAAAGQVGHWSGMDVSGPIEDLGGNPTPVWLLVPPNQPGTGNSACTSGDDEALMDDAHVPQTATYRFSGLIPGDYAIYTYAMDPTDPLLLTNVEVTDSSDPSQIIGGDFCGGHVQGATYALHHVTTSNGLIFITVSGNSGNFSVINGFQVVCESCTTGTALCFGAGGACPCGNDGSASSGCANGSGSGAELTGTGVPSTTNDTVVLQAAGASPNQPGLFFQGTNFINGGNGLVFGDGLRCCGANVVRLQIRVADGGGNASTTVPVSATGGVNAGDARCYQFWYRDPLASPCGGFFNLSNGYRIDWL